jgi:hypothetical protein
MLQNRTWVITIYRQTLLPDLDFADMTYTGVLATILSGLEPAVAIALACVPLMRPLFGKKGLAKERTGYDYNSSKTSGAFSKKGSKNGSRGPSTFTELVDDDSSEIHLQPIKPAHEVSVSATPMQHNQRQSMSTSGQTITMERKWEVRQE